jgi:hypothetical protein
LKRYDTTVLAYDAIPDRDDEVAGTVNGRSNSEYGKYQEHDAADDDRNEMCHGVTASEVLWLSQGQNISKYSPRCEFVYSNNRLIEMTSCETLDN